MEDLSFNINYYLNERYSLIELSNGENFFDVTVLEHIFDDEKNKRIKIAYVDGICYRIAEIKLSAIIKIIPFAVRKTCQIKKGNCTYMANLSDEEIKFNTSQGIQVIQKKNLKK